MLLIWKFNVNVLRSGFCLLWGRERTTHKIVQCKVQVRNRTVHTTFSCSQTQHLAVWLSRVCCSSYFSLHLWQLGQGHKPSLDSFMCVPMPTQSSTPQVSENSFKGGRGGGGNSKTFFENLRFLLVLISGAQLHESIMVVSTERPRWLFWGVLHQRKPHLQSRDLSLKSESTQLLEMHLHLVFLKFLLSLLPYFPSGFSSRQC